MTNQSLSSILRLARIGLAQISERASSEEMAALWNIAVSRMMSLPAATANLTSPKLLKEKGRITNAR